MFRSTIYYVYVLVFFVHTIYIRYAISVLYRGTRPDTWPPDAPPLPSPLVTTLAGMDGGTDLRTDRPSQRDARTHLTMDDTEVISEIDEERRRANLGFPKLVSDIQSEKRGNLPADGCIFPAGEVA